MYTHLFCIKKPNNPLNYKTRRVIKQTDCKIRSNLDKRKAFAWYILADVSLPSCHLVFSPELSLFRVVFPVRSRSVRWSDLFPPDLKPPLFLVCTMYIKFYCEIFSRNMRWPQMKVGFLFSQSEMCRAVNWSKPIPPDCKLHLCTVFLLWDNEERWQMALSTSAIVCFQWDKDPEVWDGQIQFYWPQMVLFL